MEMTRDAQRLGKPGVAGRQPVRQAGRGAVRRPAEQVRVVHQGGADLAGIVALLGLTLGEEGGERLIDADVPR
jgi:hypothetical protein